MDFEDTAFALLLGSLLAVPAWVGLRRASDLCVLGVQDGAVRLVRGHLPSAVLRDLGDVLARSRARGRLRIFTRSGSAHVEAKGEFSQETLQRVRNVIGNVPLQRLRSARPAARR